MEKRKFIFVETISKKGHIIPVDSIKYISPNNDKGENNSSINIINSSEVLHSTETPKEIFQKIKDL